MNIAVILRLLLICLFGALASLAQAQWLGPTQGPAAVPGKRVLFLASDFRNGGVAGVYRGVKQAARRMGWQVQGLDGRGDPGELLRLAEQALREPPDGLVLGGFGAEMLGELPASFRLRKIPLVGWHASDKPGPTRWLFDNITTDPLLVADLAAELVIEQRPVGVVIFTDSQFAIATTKAQHMAARIAACADCRLLSIEDQAISRAAEDMPARVKQLQQRFGSAWTHTLAINDVYFDHINVPLARLGRRDIRLVSAGDGSAKALGRIQSGLSQQIATVAEPLEAHGWQVMDELNRAFAAEPPSGYVARPLLVTTKPARASDRRDSTTETEHQSGYLRLWRPH